MSFVFMKAVAMEWVMVPNDQLARCHGNAATLAAVGRSPCSATPAERNCSRGSFSVFHQACCLLLNTEQGCGLESLSWTHRVPDIGKYKRVA